MNTLASVIWFVLMKYLYLYGRIDIKTGFDSTTILVANAKGGHREQVQIEEFLYDLSIPEKNGIPPKDTS